jgi:hypothetical protein
MSRVTVSTGGLRGWEAMIKAVVSPLKSVAAFVEAAWLTLIPP